MRYSSFVDRIAGESVEAWKIHSEAMAAQRRGEDVIVLSVGDPEFSTAEPIVEQAVAALRAGDTHYSEMAGRSAVRVAIARDHAERIGDWLTPANTILLAGAQNALFATSLCLCEAGDEILVPEPMYLTYRACIEGTGAVLVPVPVDAQTLRIDVDRIRAAVTKKTKALFYATPCNPTGIVMSEEELSALRDIAVEHDLWVVSDEVYADITFDHKTVSIASLPDMRDRTVTIGSLSKSHAMAGWRAGWAIGPTTLICHMERLALCMLYGLPGFVQQAALLAIENRQKFVGEIRAHYLRRRDLVCAELETLQILQFRRPEAGMFVLVDVRATGLSATEFAWRLFRETGVSVLDASPFGATISGFVRLGLVVEEERLLEACRRIRRFVNSLEPPRQLGPSRSAG